MKGSSDGQGPCNASGHNEISVNRSDLVEFEPVDSAIQLTEEDDANEANRPVETCVMSDGMAVGLPAACLTGSEQVSGGGRMKPRVYVETTVVSYLTVRMSYDVRVLAHHLDTRDWWRDARARFELVASPLVVDEARVGAPQATLDRLSVLESLAIIHPSDASQVLGQQFIEAHALPAVAALEATHIAIAVASGIEYLATWNFRHIANPANKPRIDQVCRNAGLRPPIICTPRQLMEV